MNEPYLIAVYIALTDGNEALARSVVIHLDLILHRNRGEFS
jgi:hypothetical protein